MNKLKQILNNFLKSNFGRNIALVAGGTAFAQVLGIVFSPIITRLYPPDQYGILTVYIATLGLISTASSFDYQKAIPIADDDENAINVSALSIIILLIFIIATTLSLTIWGNKILSVLDSDVLRSYKYLIPVGVLFTGIYEILLQWVYRERNYGVITRNKVNQSIFSNIFKVITGVLRIGPIGLIFGYILGQSAGITTLAKPIFKNRSLFKKIKLFKIKEMAKRYIRFPIYSAPSNYIYNAGKQLPIIILTSLYGNTVVGLFGLANSIVSMPIDLIGTSVSQVFYAEAAKIKENPAKLKSLSLKLVKKMALIGLVPLFTLLLFGPFIFSLVFGIEWYQAGVYARILSVKVYFHFVIMPIGRVLEIFEKQREGLLLNAVRLILILIVFGASKLLELTAFNAIILFSAINSLTYLLLLILVYSVMNNEIKKIMLD